VPRGRPRKQYSSRWGSWGNAKRTAQEGLQCQFLYKYTGKPGDRFHRYACRIKPTWRSHRPVIWVKHTCTKCGKWCPGNEEFKGHKIRAEPKYLSVLKWNGKTIEQIKHDTKPRLPKKYRLQVTLHTLEPAAPYMFTAENEQLIKTAPEIQAEINRQYGSQELPEDQDLLTSWCQI